MYVWIVLICFCILFLFIFVSCFVMMKKELFSLSNKYLSVIILSHNRPHNLEKSIPILCSYSFIYEILIFHGNKQNYRNFKSVNHVMVKNIIDYINNDIYGGARRFFHFSKCTQELILFLDDDMIPSKEFLMNALSHFKTKPYPNNIVGKTERSCDSSGYSTKKIPDNNSLIILTGCAIIPKKVVEKYMDIAFPFFESWIKKYKGNCEDISMNLFIKNYYNNIPIHIKDPVQELDISNGYHSQKYHYDIRDAFCKSFHHVIFPIRSLPESNKSFFDMFISFYKQHEGIFNDIRPPLLDGIVDQVYCICLENRKEHMTKVLKENHLFSHTMFVKPISVSDITRTVYNMFSDTLVNPHCVIYYKLSKLPVHLSYLMVMYHSMIHQFRHVIILEDDIHFNQSSSVIHHYIKTYRSIVSPSVNSILYLGYCGLNCKSDNIQPTETPLLYHINSFENIYCKHAILHNTLYFSLFFNSHEKLQNASDHTFNLFYKKYSIQRFITNVSLIDQDRNMFDSKNENFGALKTCAL